MLCGQAASLKSRPNRCASGGGLSVASGPLKRAAAATPPAGRSCPAGIPGRRQATVKRSLPPPHDRRQLRRRADRGASSHLIVPSREPTQLQHRIDGAPPPDLLAPADEHQELRDRPGTAPTDHLLPPAHEPRRLRTNPGRCMYAPPGARERTPGAQSTDHNRSDIAPPGARSRASGAPIECIEARARSCSGSCTRGAPASELGRWPA